MRLPYNFNGKVSSGLLLLCEKGRAITHIATGLFGIFLPIFLFELFNNNFNWVAIYFISWSVIYGVSVCWLARLYNKAGFRWSLQIGTILGALYYATLIFVNKSNAAYLLPLSVVILIFHILFYWVPYHVGFSVFSDLKNRGKEVGALSAVSYLLGIVTPVIAGFVIVNFGFKALFFSATIVFLAAMIPYRKIPQVNEQFSWDYKKSWVQFFSKKQRGTMLAFAADGAGDAFTSVVWPIFMFQILKGNYLEVGMISTLVGLSLVVFNLSLGGYLDKKVKKKGVLKLGIWLVSLGFIFKIFVATAFQIFIVDVYHKITKVFVRIPVDTIMYDTASKQKHNVDEFVVLHEMSCNLGRAVMLVLVMLALMVVSLKWVFLLGALVTTFLYMLNPKLKIGD